MVMPRDLCTTNAATCHMIQKGGGRWSWESVRRKGAVAMLLFCGYNWLVGWLVVVFKHVWIVRWLREKKKQNT